MNRRFRLPVLLTLAVLLGCIFGLSFYSEAHPPELSHGSGFYEEAFSLTISSPNGWDIYYTLDGSDPDETGILYTGPIRVEDATANPNRYAAREDLSTGFYRDLILENGQEHMLLAYRAPDFPVDKCTVLRAVAVHPNGSKVSREVNGSYFVGIRPEDYLGCNVISIITDPDNLFDPDTGIYVTGTAFEKFLQKGDLTAGWFNWFANYRQRGPEWERQSVFHIFDRNGNLALSKDGGIRIRGSATRGFLPRSLNLFAREEYDGVESFSIPLFDSSFIPSGVTLTSGGNAYVTQFNDYAMTWLIRDRNVATTLFSPYILFLDGEYWGFYWLSEKFDEDYFQHYYGVAADNVVMIKMRTSARTDLVEVGLPGDEQLYFDMENFFLSQDLSDPENYARALELIDVESCIDYYASMIYIARRSDWPQGNVGLWRSRDSSGTGYSDGRWRWVVFDCNGAGMRGGVDAPTGAILEAHDTLSYVLETDGIFASLWKNEAFRNAFRDRILEMADTNFAYDRVSAFVEDYSRTMTPILEKSWARFYGSENDLKEQFDFIVETYHLFFRERKAVVESWFAE